MKTLIRKQGRKDFIGALAAAALAATALCPSCKFNIIDAGGRETGGGGSTCKLTVRFQETNQSSSASTISRTVVPVIEPYAARYDVQCLNAGGATIASASITAISGSADCTFTDLVPGSVTVKVKAYKDEAATALIATGETTATLTPGNTSPATVILNPVLTPGATTGSFALTIKWPTASASTLAWSLDGQAATVLQNSDITTAGGTSTATLSAAGRTSGVHTIRLFFNENEKQTQLEVINVYDNLKSDKWIRADGTLADFREYSDDDVKPAAQAGATEATLRILDGSRMETFPLTNPSATLTTGHSVAGTGITIIASAAITGQKLEYKMNSGGWFPLISDAPAVIPVTQDGSTQTLNIRVTSQNAGTASAYQIILRTPIHVSNETQLINAFSAMDNDIVLDGGFSLSSEWAPKGTSDAPYTGTFDGNGKTISGLTVADQDNAGLFGCVGAGGVVKNVTLTGVDMRNAKNIKGAIAGLNKGLIYRCSSSGTLSGGEQIGGLVGSNLGTIEECWSNASVSGYRYLGGLAGSNGEYAAGGAPALIKNCYARGAVAAVWGGGLVGRNYTTGRVLNSYAAGRVSPNGMDSNGNLQELVGKSVGAQTNSYFDQTKIAISYSGGTAITSGYNGFAESTAAMRTQGTYSNWDFGSVWSVSAGTNGGYPYLQHVTPTTDKAITDQAGLANINSALSDDYYLSGPITVSGSWTSIGSASGKFTGTFDGRTNAITFSGPVAASLFGYVDLGARVENLHVAYPSGLSGVHLTAGITGYNYGTIDRCSVTGSITCTGQYIAGIAGTNHGTINECYSSATVSGATDVGGIAGDNETGGNITNSYNRGSITGDAERIGGIVGYQWGSDSPLPVVTNCYSTGAVSGPTSGGAIGQLNSGTVNYCYYDSERSLMSDTGKGTGITDDETRQQSTFASAGWDFSGVWTIAAGKNAGYPCLIYNTATTDIAVATQTDLDAIRSNLNGDYKLTSDIVLSGNWTPIGTLSTSPFTGTFDGGGHTIWGLKVVTGGATSAGLFGCNKGAIQNVKITGATVDAGSHDCAGVLAAENNGIIQHCASTGSIEVRGSSYIGGLAGINRGTISECYSTVPVYGTSSSIGGLVGRNEKMIVNCYSTGTVSSVGTDVGGLSGIAWGSISNSYSTGNVTGSTNFGGFVGTNNGNASGCFYSGTPDNGIGTFKAVSDLQTATTFTSGGSSWDLLSSLDSSHIWGIDTTKTINNGYPYLQYFGAATVSRSITLAKMYNNATDKTFVNGDLPLTDTNLSKTGNSAWKTTTATWITTSDPDLIFGSSDSFTICGWFRIDDFSAGGSLFYRGGDSGSLNYGIWVQSGGTIQAQVTKSGVGGSSLLAYPRTQGQWFHVAFVYSSSALSLYVNTVLVDTQTLTETATEGYSFGFGGFNGVMSDLKIFNRALDTIEIGNVWDNGAP